MDKIAEMAIAMDAAHFDSGEKRDDELQEAPGFLFIGGFDFGGEKTALQEKGDLVAGTFGWMQGNSALVGRGRACPVDAAKEMSQRDPLLFL